jgi:calcineurin-like phosphoesterase family protein
MAVDRWYISDHHLFHYNILKYGERPFANLGEMHDALVTYHNELVKPNHHVSFLGDVTILRGGRVDKERFINEVRRYNGHKRLYLGNHDHWNVELYKQAGFEKIYATWRSEEGFITSHIPLHPRSLSTANANVHGHIHQAATYEPVIFPEWKKDNGKVVPAKVVPYINVSVEAVKYKPMHLDEILAIINRYNDE